MNTLTPETMDLETDNFTALGLRRKWASQSHKVFMTECLGFPAKGNFYSAIGQPLKDALFTPMILRSRLEFIGVAIVAIAIGLLTAIGIAWLAGSTLQLNLAIGLLLVILAIMIGFAQSPKLANIDVVESSTDAEKSFTKRLMRLRQAAMSAEVVIGGTKNVWKKSIAVEVGAEAFESRIGLLLTLGKEANSIVGPLHWPMPLPIVTNVSVVAGSKFETELLIHRLAQKPQEIQQASNEEIDLLKSVLGQEGLLEGWVTTNIEILHRFREGINRASSPTALWTEMKEENKFGGVSHVRAITRGANDRFNDQLKAASTQITHRYNSI